MCVEGFQGYRDHFPGLFQCLDSLHQFKPSKEVVTLYGGDRREVVCRILWHLLSAYYSFATAFAESCYGVSQLPPYRINKNKTLFERSGYPVYSNLVNGSPAKVRSDVEILQRMSLVAIIITSFLKLPMYQSIMEDLGCIHRVQSPTAPSQSNTADTDTDTRQQAEAELDDSTVEEQEAEAEMDDINKAVEAQEAVPTDRAANKLTRQFMAWVQLSVAHIIAGNNLYASVTKHELSVTFRILPAETYEEPAGSIPITKIGISEQTRKQLCDYHEARPKNEFQPHGVVHCEMPLLRKLFDIVVCKFYCEDSSHSCLQGAREANPKRPSEFVIAVSKPCCPVCHQVLHTVGELYDCKISIHSFHNEFSAVMIPACFDKETGQQLIKCFQSDLIAATESITDSDDYKTHRKSDSSSSAKSDTSVQSLEESSPDIQEIQDTMDALDALRGMR